MSRPIHTYPAETIQRIGTEADRFHPRGLRTLRLAYNVPLFAAMYAAIGWGFALLWSYAGPTVACVVGGALYGANAAWVYVANEWSAERKAHVDEALWLETAEGRAYEREIRDRILEYR